MKRKTTLISLILIGFVFVLTGSAWAGGNHRPHDRRGHYYHKNDKHHGHHYRKTHGGRHNRAYHHGPRHRGWRHHRPHRRPIEKHVYHHYSNEDTYTDDQYYVAGTQSAPGFSFSFGISGSR